MRKYLLELIGICTGLILGAILIVIGSKDLPKDENYYCGKYDDCILLLKMGKIEEFEICYKSKK